MSDVSLWQLACDGSAVPNPGRQGLAAVLRSPDGARHVRAMAWPSSGCNNEAELRALMLGLTMAQAHGARQLRIQTDSSVLVDQLADGRAPTIQRLLPLLREALDALAGFDHVQWLWVPRHRNAEADALARGVHGLGPKPGRPVGMKKNRRKL
ncbi:ribonuclease HI family protein [Aquabacterium sp.]|uniref:ribonuclease HI family protein n=1 Tax=Aquabacterium sp. TaxID=1872578 RepID=UPI00248A68A4|nr:ribonuclease HI family protein [Aquabacterium sp.]MDI1347903.1 ribonuclease HI family protein [Aquabacterium sp.]